MPFGCGLSPSNRQRRPARFSKHIDESGAVQSPRNSDASPEPTAGSRLHARRSQSMAMANMQLMFAADRRVGCPFVKMGPPRCGHCQATGRRPARHALLAEGRRASLARDQLAAMRNAGGALRVDAPCLDDLETRWSQYIEKSGLRSSSTPPFTMSVGNCHLSIIYYR